MTQTALYNRQYYICLAVADGVGGWRNYGIDPSLFSSALMDNSKN